jgi:hypothetical protein
MRNRILLIIIGFLTLSQFGCGQMLTGTYVGSESPTLNGASLQADPLTISISHTNNDSIAGSWQTSRGGGNFTGRPTGEITLTYTLTSPHGNTPLPVAAAPTTTTYNPQTGQPMTAAAPTSNSLPCGNYTGKLSITERQITGRVELTQPAAMPANVSGAPGSISTYCPQSRSISVTKN